MVSVSRILQQQQKENSGQKDATSWDAGSSMQVIVLLQQMFDKLEVLSGTVDGLKNDLRVAKETTEQDIEALKLDLNYKADRVEDKIQNLGKDLDSQTDRLEDKIEDFEKDQNEKLNQLKEKTESILVHLRDNFESPINHKSVTESCTDKTANCVEGIVNKEIMSFNEKLSTIKDEISLLWKNVADSINVSCSKVVQKLDSRQALDQTLQQNLTQTSLKSTSQDDKDFASFVERKFDLLQNDMRVKFHEMSERMNLSDAETRSLFNTHTSVKNATFGYLQPALTELLTPTECYKGMSSLALSTSSPYAVIQPNKVNSLSAPVLCDTFTDGGGWTVFQRRVIGDVTFFRKWQDYKNGFGSFNGDFWLGNDNINAMTQNGVFELQIDMMYNGKFAYAHYDSFSVGDESSNYVLRVSSYKGDAGESLLTHNGMPFSTHDRDNDNWSRNCAVEYVGAWWYNACHTANLNGQWGSGSNKGPRWNTFSGVNAVTYSEMKFRRLV